MRDRKMTKSWRRGSRFTAFRTGFNNERPIALIQVNMRIHIILNSHLDPVWLWRREQGIDEVIATARTACNLLEAAAAAAGGISGVSSGSR